MFEKSMVLRNRWNHHLDLSVVIGIIQLFANNRSNGNNDSGLLASVVRKYDDSVIGFTSMLTRYHSFSCNVIDTEF